MNYIISIILLTLLFLLYLYMARRYDVVSMPNERNLQSHPVITGAGVIFIIALVLWEIFFYRQYLFLFAGVMIVSIVSFADDVRNLSVVFRLLFQFLAAALVFCDIDVPLWVACLAVVPFVGMSNIFNFMDGINGMHAFMSLVVLVSLYLANCGIHFVEPSLLLLLAFSVVVFAVPNVCGKCFCGDVGSIGLSYILLFLIARIVVVTGDLSWLLFVSVYAFDGISTIVRRLFLHENIFRPHRHHLYQWMVDSLNIHPLIVSSVYALLQLAISGFVLLSH